MSKPSILLINRVYPPVRGATGRLLRDLAHALEQSGWKVTILTTGEMAGTEANKSIKVRRIKASSKHKTTMRYLWIWARLLLAALRVNKHDVVLTLTDPPMMIIIGRMVKLFKGSKHVHWCQDLYPDLFKPLGVRLPGFLRSYLAGLSKKALNRCDQVIVIGRCMAQKLKDNGIEAEKIALIANWADFEVITPSGDHKIEPLKIDVTGIAKKPEEMFRDDSPKFRILYAGNIGRTHPMRSVIEAAAILSEYSEIEFVFIGNKHVHSILARERARRGLENIKFMPYQPIERLRDVMESGDVHLVTMRDEVQGMVVPCKFYSGLTVGRPTVFVGPDGAEIAQVIKDYNAGKTVPVKDARALADAIYNYRTNGEEWFQAQEGALRAAQAYHPNRSLHKWLDVLEQVRR